MVKNGQYLIGLPELGLLLTVTSDEKEHRVFTVKNYWTGCTKPLFTNQGEEFIPAISKEVGTG